MIGKLIRSSYTSLSPVNAPRVRPPIPSFSYVRLSMSSLTRSRYFSRRCSDFWVSWGHRLGSSHSSHTVTSSLVELPSLHIWLSLPTYLPSLDNPVSCVTRSGLYCLLTVKVLWRPSSPTHNSRTDLYVYPSLHRRSTVSKFRFGSQT